MKQFLFSDDMALIQRWENILGKATTHLIDDFDSLYQVSDAIVIFNSCACGNKCDVIIDVLISNNNKVLILDRVPDFYKAQKRSEERLCDNRQANRHFHHQIAKPLEHLDYNTQGDL